MEVGSYWIRCAGMFCASRCIAGVLFCFFFFQAEDGIRDVAVTGVQTCALPIFHRAHDLVRHVRALLARRAEQGLADTPLAEARERAPELRRKEHDEGDDPERPEVVEQPHGRVELELPSQERRGRERTEADHHLHRARAPEHDQDTVDHDRDEEDVERVTPAEGGERIAHGAPARPSRSATRMASSVSAVSWVRITAAPCWTAIAVAASDPASRSAGPRRPVIAPMNDLRDTPTQTGLPSCLSADSPASTAESHASQGIASCRKKPTPGSTTIRSSGIPAARARPSAAPSSPITSSIGSTVGPGGPGRGRSTTRSAFAWPIAVGLHHGVVTSAFDAAGTGLADPAPIPPDPPRSGVAVRITLARCSTTSAAPAGSRSPATSLITRAPASSAPRAGAARAVP